MEGLIPYFKKEYEVEPGAVDRHGNDDDKERGKRESENVPDWNGRS